MLPLLTGLASAALAIAFAAQWFVSPLRRTRVIFAAAGVPTLLPPRRA